MIQQLDYWYDRQMPRFLEQIVRAFSGFQYKTGMRDGQEGQLRMVPCRIALTDRMVGSILRNLSENTLLTVPMITVHQTSLQFRREDVQHPGHVDTRQVIQRAVDPVTGAYTSERGSSMTVRRLMPRPFTMGIQVDIWTSNQDQKYQLSEQILPLVVPGFDIQNSDNALDWSAMTTALLDDMTWSSRSIPIGTDGEIDIMTIQLRLPIWLSPPAEVRQQRIIEQIVTNINEGDAEAMEDVHAGSPMGRVITTPGNHHVRVTGSEIVLLNAHGSETAADGQIYSWETLLRQYGHLRPTESQIRLKIGNDIEGGPEIIGSIQLDATTPNRLFWSIDIDTLPANTLPPVTAVIDPLRIHPANGLPTPTTGTRYLLIADIGPSSAWGNVTAMSGDIIEWQNNVWVVSFDASEAGTTNQYVLNVHTGRQLRWAGQEWVMAIDGVYAPGFWRLAL